MRLLRECAIACTVFSAQALAQAPGLENIGAGVAFGISADGRVVVGQRAVSISGSAPSGATAAFRWTQEGGMETLGTLSSSVISAASAANADGSVIVGTTNAFTLDNSRRHAFRWTSAGMQDLGTLNGGTFSVGRGVSADGSVVVGEAADGALNNAGRAFRWTQTGGMTSLGILPTGATSAATGVSADGSVVVGTSNVQRGGSVPFFASRAFRWTAEGGMENLGSISFDGTSAAYGVSADGRVVVGEGSDMAVNAQQRAFRWTREAGMVSLGTLAGGHLSAALAVNADGSVVVGWSSVSDGGHRAFRWTDASGMQSVEDWLRAHGIPVAVDVTAEATGVSGDGSIVAGNLRNGDGFIARLSAANSSGGLVSFSDLNTSLASSASAPAQSASLGAVVMHGNHSRPLARRAEPGKSCAWVAGDVGTDNHAQRDGSFALGEIGGCHRLADGLQGSLSIGYSSSRQNLVFDGRSDVQGTYGMAELLGNIAGTRLWWSAGLLYLLGDADVKRGYPNAGVADFSSGRPDVQGSAARLRVDWEDVVRWGASAFTPYADLTYARTEIDAYSETGGGFPASFDARTNGATEFRMGVDAAYALSSSTKLTGRVEAAHGSDKSGPTTNGTLIGLFSFSVPGEEIKQDWLRVGVGADTKLGKGTLSAMLNATSEGAAPSSWLNISYQLSF
jgi:probable HAF family extracellular repeat protein